MDRLEQFINLFIDVWKNGISGINISEIIIALPGGIGTLEELFEMITWKQLGFHSKPIYLLNVLEYWNLFINNLYHMIKIGFLEKEAINYFKVCETVDEIFLDLKDKGLIES